jgi:hypothetical protein
MTTQPNVIRYGALPEEWDRFVPLGVPLLTVVANPDAPSSPQSKIPPENRGKVPTRFNPQRQVVGIPDWTNKQIVPQGIDTCKKDPDLGFCVITGRGMVGVDVDVTDAELGEEIQKAVAEIVGSAVPVRRRVNSPKFLIPLLVPGDVAKQVIDTRAGRVELLGRGQQFIAAGTHPSGVRYEWTWPASGVPQLTPEQWTNLVAALAERFAVKPVKSSSAKAATKSDAPPIVTDEDAAVARAVEFLRGVPPAIEGQGGDDHVFRTLCRNRDFGVPKHRAAEALAQWNTRCSPPWDADELGVKIENAYTYAQEPAGKLTPEALGFEVVPGAEKASIADVLPGSDAAQARKEVFGEAGDPYPEIPRAPGVMAKPAEAPAKSGALLKAQGIRAEDYLRSDYLIKHWIERRTNALIFGEWNAGKSFVILDMCASVASGVPWFGHRVRAGRALYCTYEGWRGIRKRWGALRTKYPTLDDQPFDIGQLTYPLTAAEGHRQLATRLAEFAQTYGGPPDLLVIDPLQQALGGDDSDAGLMGRLNTLVNVVMERQGCTVLRCHHSGHSNKGRSRGHSSLPAGVDVEIQVKATGERLGEITGTKQRDDARGKLGFRLAVVDLGRDDDDERVTSCIAEPAPLGNVLDLSEPQQAVMGVILTTAGDGRTVARGSVLEACRAAGIVPDGTRGRERLRDLLNQLATKERITFDADAVNVLARGAAGLFDEEEGEDD